MNIRYTGNIVLALAFTLLLGIPDISVTMAGADTIPPTSVITSPRNNSSTASPVYIQAKATDNIGVTRVDFFRNGQLISSDTTAPYAAIWETSTGMHNLTAVAYDAAGNSTTSAIVRVNILNSPLIVKGAVALDTTTVDVRFSTTINSATVNQSLFSMSGLSIFSATLQPDQKTVRLTTSLQSTQMSYTITVFNAPPTINDTNGNQLGFPNTATFLGYNSAATGAMNTVTGSKHDLAHLNQRPTVIAAGIGNPMEGASYNNYLDTCVYCHVPHTGGGADGGAFNRTLPQDNYKIYTGPTGTMDATPNRPGGVSLVCLSCHDGTIAVDSIVKTPETDWRIAPNHMKMNTGFSANECGSCHRENGIFGAHDGGSKYLTQDLRDDHPISMSYLEAKNATPKEFNDPFFIAPLKLFNNKVECPTCHDVHNPQYTPFLRKPNVESSLCNTCHIK